MDFTFFSRSLAIPQRGSCFEKEGLRLRSQCLQEHLLAGAGTVCNLRAENYVGLGVQSSDPQFQTGKVNFCTGTGRKAFFRIFFRLILDPPPGTYALTAKKGKFICTGHFFPYGMAFLEKRGGLVPVYVFIFPVQRAAKGGLDPSWLDLAFLGRPDFQFRGPQIPIFEGFWDCVQKNRGAPKTANPTTTDPTPHLRPSDS